MTRCSAPLVAWLREVVRVSRRHDAGAPHAPPRDVDRDDRIAIALDALARLRRSAEPLEDVAADGLGVLDVGLEPDAGIALEIRQEDAPVDVDDAAAPPVDGRHLLVRLVA